MFKGDANTTHQPGAPLPAPLPLVEALQSIEVTHSDEGRSGFQITFAVGRGGPLGLLDYPYAPPATAAAF